MPDSELGKLLTRAGIGTKYSYRVAGRMCGVSHATIDRLHKGQHVATGQLPRARTIVQLAAIPGLNVVELQRAVVADMNLSGGSETSGVHHEPVWTRDALLALSRSLSPADRVALALDIIKESS